MTTVDSESDAMHFQFWSTAISPNTPLPIMQKAPMTTNYLDRDPTVNPRRGQIENAQKSLD